MFPTASGKKYFQRGFETVQSIVESMETEDLPLALLSRFGGTKLAQVCQAKLAEAELKFSNWRKTRGVKWS
jgi:exonuclease VII small subunit